MSCREQTVTEQVLGYGAAIVTTLASVPQLIQVFKTKKADDISYTFLIVLNTGMTMWLAYGIMESNMPLIASNVVNLSLWGTIAGLKYMYRSSSITQNSITKTNSDLEIAPLRCLDLS